MYFANFCEQNIHHAPQRGVHHATACGGTAIVSHPRSQNIMYRLKLTLRTDYVGIMFLATARYRDKDFIADIFVLCYNTNMKKDKLKIIIRKL